MAGRIPAQSWNTHPVVIRTNRILKRALEGYPKAFRLLRSRNGGFEAVRNRLKALCRLDPVIFRRPRTGWFVVALANTPSHLPDGPFVCRVRFDDAGADPQVSLAFEVDTGIRES